MKILLLFILMILTTSSQADFTDAQKYYENKDFKHAYSEFNQLAKLGNQKSNRH